MAEYYPTCSRCGKKSEEPMDGHPMACLICPECSGAEKEAKERKRQLQPAALLNRIEALEQRLEDLDLDRLIERVESLERDVKDLESGVY